MRHHFRMKHRAIILCWNAGISVKLMSNPGELLPQAKQESRHFFCSYIEVQESIIFNFRMKPLDTEENKVPWLLIITRRLWIQQLQKAMYSDERNQFRGDYC